MENKVYAYWMNINQLITSSNPFYELTMIERSQDYTQYEISYQSLDQARIYGKLWTPNHPNNKCIVLFHGLGAHTSTEGYLAIALRYVAHGFHVVGFDVRLQGGKTIDPTKYRYLEYGLYAGNIDSLFDYYYIKVYQDALMLMHVIDQIDFLKDTIKIATGGSQGGALALFVSSIRSNIDACVVDIPSCCNIPYLMNHSDGGFKQVNQLLMDVLELTTPVMNQLSYIDLMNLTSYIKCRVLASVGGLDTICPPESFESTYQQIKTYKQRITYPEYGHGGFDLIHFPKKLAFINKDET